MQVEFKAAGPRTREPGPEGDGGAGGIGQVTEKGAPLARMALFAVYGYADKTGGNRAESAAMWNTVKERAGKFRARHRTGTVVLAGDLNAAKWSALDTDRQEAGMWDRESDAALITWIEGNLKVKDSFREAHPRERAHTRNPQGKKALTDAKRRIDQIWVSGQAAGSPHMRAGIPKEPRQGVGSDHRPMITDIGIDCAGMANGTAPLWDPHTVTTLQAKKGVTEEDREEMNRKFQEAMEAGEQGGKGLEARGAAMMTALQEAMDGTIANKVQQQYPKWAATTEYREGWGHKLDAWCKRMNNACCALKKMRTMPDRDKLREALEGAKWPHSDIPTGIQMDKMQDLWEQWDQGYAREEVGQRLVDQAGEIKYHETKEREKRVREKVQAAIKARSDSFDQGDGKGKGKVLSSIFRASREYEELTWARREDGTLATAHEDVERTVRSFFEKWFQSRVSVEERWGTRDNFDNLDTSQMDPRYHEFMRECYLDPMAANKEAGDREGWWEGIRDSITKEELEEAIGRSKSGTAAGPSQVGIGAIKALSGGSKAHVLAFMNACLEENKIPDCMNSALMRLLPKSDKGLADLNAVRPIALMENIIKIYEQIMVGRVLGRLMKHEVLDLGQFGALPKGGVAAPLRIMAEIMEDARRSGQELHMMVADLSKAFDTMEYWSQELSWRTMGMPQDMIDLMVNLDSGSEEGEGATTEVALGKGRKTQPFRHGRGVRQGSVGGPLKWVVFVNFWLQWVKKKMKGKGYVMSSSKSERTLEQVWEKRDGDTGERRGGGQQGTTEGTQTDGEVIGNMFVDDSLWPTRSAGSMEEVARMHETFCDFHKVFIHKKKSEYMTVNGKGVQVRWTPAGKDQTEGAREEGERGGGTNATKVVREERERDGGEDDRAGSSGGIGDTREGKYRRGAGAREGKGGSKAGQQESSGGSTEKGKPNGRKGKEGKQAKTGGTGKQGETPGGRRGGERSGVGEGRTADDRGT